MDLATDKATSTRANSQISPTYYPWNPLAVRPFWHYSPSFVMLSTLFSYNVPSSLPAKGWTESHARVLRIICHMVTIPSAKPGRDSKRKSSLECHSGLALSAKVAITTLVLDAIALPILRMRKSPCSSVPDVSTTLTAPANAKR